MIEQRKAAASVTGLVLAWGGTLLLIGPAAGLLRGSITGECLGQVGLWILFTAILLNIVFWEKLPIGSLWLKPLNLQSVFWAFLLVLVNSLVLFPATEWLRNAFGLAGYATGMKEILSLPIAFRIFAVFTAGVVEETVLRAYTITRLAQLFGSPLLAAALSVIAFAAVHVPVWGVGPAVAFMISSSVMTAFFLWKRDLVTMIIAHIAIDAWAIVVTPHFFDWWN